MPGNVLITGTSGYLGGSLCSQLCQLGVPDLKIFALVRSASQYDLVRQMGAEPLTFDAYEQSSVSKVINENSINIVYYLIDCDKSNGAFCFIRALADLKKESGMETHLIFVVDVVKAALAAGRVYNPNPGSDELWPVCHLHDTISLYVKLLSAITRSQRPAHGKNGYYLASSGQIAWADVYSAFARALAKRGLVEDANVARPDEPALEKMAAALGCQPSFVPVWMGGHCTYTAKHGQDLGWSPQYSAGHLLEVADEGVEFILDQLKK
ncbi:hypothetical protein KJ359_011419 [Pestalotiopsis sp. 9143b]|nr:hypothetical protein KJ359_011419 [Pestalotiopsis sp. 9143b]